VIVSDYDPDATRRHRRPFLFSLLACLLLLATVLESGPLGARPLLLEQDIPARAIGKSALALMEPPGAPMGLAAAQAAAAAGLFQPVNRAEPDFGFRPGGVWLRLDVWNPGPEPEQRILHLGTNFIAELDVWVEGQETLKVLAQRPDSQFHSRPIDYHELAVPVTLEPGKSTVWLRYRSSGSTALPLALETPQSMVALSQRSSASHFGYYGIMAVFVAGALVATAILPRPMFLAYALYVAALLLFLMQRDGHAFQLLWPDAPRWNAFASLPLGIAVGVTSAQFARLYLETRSWAPRADLLLRLLIGWGVALLLLAAFIPDRILKQLAMGSASVGALLFVLLGIARLRDGGLRYGFYVAGWMVIVVAAGFVNGTTLFDLPISRATALHITRAASVFDAAMMALAVAVGVVLLRRERDRFLRDRLAMAERNIALIGRLAKIEESHAFTQSLAERRGRLIAETAHDLRQPILALKAALMGGSGQADGTPQAAARLATAEQSVRYLEKLVESTLEAALADDSVADCAADAQPVGQEAQERGARAERLEAGALILALAAAHGEEARARGVLLRAVPSRARVRVDPLAAMRILDNLLGNAIRHGAGKVVIGARRSGGEIVIEIHDNGPGLGEGPVERLFRQRTRGANAARLAPDGKGLGLGIVSDLAAAHGLRWELRNGRRRGAIARLWLAGGW
jgi:signal transduction histidine kinase